MPDQITFIDFGKTRLGLTNEATEAATEASLTIGALFANLAVMRDENVLDEWLTDDGTTIEAALIDEVVRRREEYRLRGKASASPVISVPSIDDMHQILGEVANLLGGNEAFLKVQQSLKNALEQASRIALPEATLRGLAVSIRNHVRQVEESYLRNQLDKLTATLKERGIYARELQRSVRRRIEKILQDGGLDKAKQEIAAIEEILSIELTIPLAQCLKCWAETGEVTGRKPTGKKGNVELREVGQKIRNLGSDGVLDFGEIWQPKTFLDVRNSEVLRGVSFTPTNFDHKALRFAGFVAKGGDNGRDVCLDKSNKKEPEIGVGYDIEVIRRASDGNTYVRVIAPTVVQGSQAS